MHHHNYQRKATYIRLWAYTGSSIVGSGRANTIPPEPGFPTKKEEKKKNARSAWSTGRRGTDK